MPPYRRSFARKRARPFARKGGKFGARIRRGVTRRVGNYGRFNRPKQMGRYQRASKVELKVFDNVALAGTVAAIGGAGGSLLCATVNSMAGNGISQGSGVNQRIGNKILIKSLEIKGWIVPLTISSGFVTPGSFTTLSLVLDTQCNGAVPMVLDGTAAGSDLSPLFAYVDIGTGQWLEGDDTFQFRNLSNSGRFRVLKKKNISYKSFGNVDATHLAFQPILIDWYIKCNIPIEYIGANYALTVGQGPPVTVTGTGGSGAIGTIKSNHLFWVVNSGNNWTASYNFSTRVRYADC